ncbi:peptidyl-tRNA hydrolase 2 [Moelleriella libera RCEF 2490]|uniref:peptidyl-tRNA hydrolase n=1 Tax=Moelleriella libera RCEF 2490 TaxID=1081109 RepID=A0A168B8X5_9HYPO|nr:peptidyl-tRNA hydrolase 2 [Moelleriella libera RCEF 2490]
MAGADQGSSTQSGVIVTTALASFISGWLFGLYTSRGYLISPTLLEERQRALHDPVESDESDVDESDSILDHAPNWANGEAADEKQGLRTRARVGGLIGDGDGDGKGKDEERGGADSSSNNNEECKLVLVVRTDLGMTKGKIAAQCSHATLACYKMLAGGNAQAKEVLRRWEKRGQAKIAVQVKSEQELTELRWKALELGVTAEVIQDAGRTQIDPGSLTVLGVGPAPKSVVDKITGHLKLL